MDTLLSAKQVQEILKIDRTTIYRMLKDGRLMGVKVGGQWRFSSQKVDEMLSGGMETQVDTRPVSIEALPLHCIQPIQDVFAEVAGIGSVTTDQEGRPLVRISNACDFCKLILGSEDGRQACIQSWKQLAQQKGTAHEFYTCHAGLRYAKAPIQIHGETVAILIAGQFYLQEPDKAEEEKRLRKLAETYHIDDALLSQAASRLIVLDEHKKSQIGNWLEQVAHTFKQVSEERADLMGRLQQIAEVSAFKT